MVEHYGLPEALLLDTSELTRAAGLPIALFDHDHSDLLTGLRWQAMPTDRSAYRGKRVLLLGRGVHDLVVSAYFQAKLRIHDKAKGAVAQLGERLLCKQEVIGSIPFSSTSMARMKRG